jgi:hypothetical protein
VGILITISLKESSEENIRPRGGRRRRRQFRI